MATVRTLQNYDINKEIFPGPWGGHNWQAMAFNPNKNLVFIPSRELSFIYGRDENFETNTIQYVEGPENTKIQTFQVQRLMRNHCLFFHFPPMKILLF